jgi:hypothetical protein
LLHGWPYDIHTYVDVAPLLARSGGVRHGSMRQPAAVEVTATGGQTNGPEP